MNPVRLLRMIGMVRDPIATVNSCSVLKFNLKLFFALNLYNPVFKKKFDKRGFCQHMGIFTFSAMSSSSSHPNFTQLPPGSEFHYLRGENASLKMENHELTSTAGALFQENEDAKVLIGQKDKEIAQKNKKLEESEERLRQSIMEARAQKNQHDLDMQELGFKNEAALKKMKTQLDEKDKEREKEKSNAEWQRRRRSDYEKQALEEKIAKDAEIAQLKAEVLKLKTEKTICKQKGVNIDLLVSSEQTKRPVATGSDADETDAQEATGVSGGGSDGGGDITQEVDLGTHAQLEEVLKELQNRDTASDADSDEEDEIEAWIYTLPEEHKGLSSDGQAVVMQLDTKHYVVSYESYEALEEVDEAEIKKASLGMLTNPKLPTDEDGEIEGDFVPKA